MSLGKGWAESRWKSTTATSLSCSAIQSSGASDCRRIKKVQKKSPDNRLDSSLNLAVRGGFEPPIRCRIHTFQACSFSHSDTSPNFSRHPAGGQRGATIGSRGNWVKHYFFLLFRSVNSHTAPVFAVKKCDGREEKTTVRQQKEERAETGSAREITLSPDSQNSYAASAISVGLPPCSSRCAGLRLPSNPDDKPQRDTTLSAAQWW